jgi:hypothetical protein
MSRLHTIIGLVTVCLAGPNAWADALSSNTEAAKLAHDKALQSKAAKTQEVDDLQKRRLNLWKPIETSVRSPQTKWCDPECKKELEAFLDSKKQLDLNKLPVQQVVKDAISALGADSTSLDKVATTGANPSMQKAILQTVCGATPTGATFQEECKKRLEELNSEDAVRVAALQKADEEKKDATVLESYTQKAYEAASTAERNAADTQVSRLPARLAGVRRARCATAYCWGGDDGREKAIEPILDLPVGMYWGVGGSALADYVNANNIKIQFNAGLRYWFSYDVMSVGILLAQPDLTGTTSTISFRGKSLANSQMRRPYPTLVIGFAGDILQLSISYDELRNASSSSQDFLPEFRPNQTLSRAVVFGIAITPLTAARNGIGASGSQAQEVKK